MVLKNMHPSGMDESSLSIGRVNLFMYHCNVIFKRTIDLYITLKAMSDLFESEKDYLVCVIWACLNSQVNIWFHDISNTFICEATYLCDLFCLNLLELPDE